jgi:hypothetical protein
VADEATIQRIRRELAETKLRTMRTQRRTQRLFEVLSGRLQNAGMYVQAARARERATHAQERAAATASRLADEAAPGDPVD